MKLGIMGGTFNPPHNGHFLAAKNTKEQLGLDKVYFMPTNLPPHKSMPERSATANQRCDMVNLMLDGHSWASLCTMEIDRGGKSYTVDTLKQLHETEKIDEIVLIVGTDMLLSFEKWHKPDEICKLASFAIVARDYNDRNMIDNKCEYLKELFNAKINVIKCEALPISSTQVRLCERNKAYLPEKVAEYIAEKQLY